MSTNIYCVKVNFVNEDTFDVWKVDSISYELDEATNRIYYIDFVYETEDGIYKEAKFSEESNMIYGIDDYDLSIDDLEILIKFINLKTYKTKEFADKLIITLNCTLTPEYIYKDIFY